MTALERAAGAAIIAGGLPVFSAADCRCSAPLIVGVQRR
jgi:hypothetical protein